MGKFHSGLRSGPRVVERSLTKDANDAVKTSVRSQAEQIGALEDASFANYDHAQEVEDKFARLAQVRKPTRRSFHCAPLRGSRAHAQQPALSRAGPSGQAAVSDARRAEYRSEDVERAQA